MGAVKQKMILTEEAIDQSKEKLDEIIVALEGCGLSQKATRLKEARRLLDIDMWDDSPLSNIKQIWVDHREAKHLGSTYFSCHVTIEFWDHCKSFVIGKTYGYDNAWIACVIDHLNKKIGSSLDLYRSKLPFELFSNHTRVQSLKHLHKGESV